MRLDDETIAAATPEELPAMAGEAERLKAAVYARLTSAAAAKPREEPDRNVDIEEAATLTGMSQSWLKQRADDLPFTVRIGRRRLFSLRGIERWNRLQARATRA